MDDAAGAHELDLTRLAPWLRAHVELPDGTIEVRKFSGGQSNPTYAILVEDAPGLVLRKKPSRFLLPTAHAVEREYRVTRALLETGVPSPGPMPCARMPTYWARPSLSWSMSQVETFGTPGCRNLIGWSVERSTIR